MKTYLCFSLLLLALLPSCRSEQAAYQFQPAPLLATRAETAAAKPIPHPTRPGPVVCPANAVHAFTRGKQHTETQRLARRKPQRHKMLNPVANRQKVAQQSTAPRQIRFKNGGFLQVPGTVFAVGGIILGFAIGGWVGFGVFALCALAGLLLAFWGSFIIDGELP